MKLSEEMRQAPEGSPLSPVERWWYDRLVGFSVGVEKLETKLTKADVLAEAVDEFRHEWIELAGSGDGITGEFTVRYPSWVRDKLDNALAAYREET